jgi:hypothetical protein
LPIAIIRSFVLGAGVMLVAASTVVDQAHRLGTPIAPPASSAKETSEFHREQSKSTGWIDTTNRAAVQEPYNNVLLPTSSVPIAVTLRRGGTNLPVQLEAVHNGYGENALVWVVSAPDLPQSPLLSDRTYSVTAHNVVVGGLAEDYSYDVVAFNPAGQDRAFALGGLPNDVPVAGSW